MGTQTVGKKPRGITKANAPAMVAHRRAIGKMGGRPKGVLNKATILRIQSRETFVEEVSKRAGILADDLMRASSGGDTRATLGALDRIGIAPVQQIKHEITHRFSLVELGDERKIIDGNPDTRIVESVPHVIDVSEEE